MPEDMSDKMPEGLPVTKRIDVIVGITRSRVIQVGDFFQFIQNPYFYIQVLSAIILPRYQHKCLRVGGPPNNS